MARSTSTRRGDWIGDARAADKSLIVSLHDAHPGSRAAIEEQLGFLAGSWRDAHEHPRRAGVSSRGFRGRGQTFCEAVSAWQAAGHEIVLHGYFHDRRASPRETLGTLFWTRLYTSREAEFLDLPVDEARVRLRRGRELFAAQGWNVRGFIAPAWLMAPHMPGAARGDGIRLHEPAARHRAAAARSHARADHLAIALLQHARGLAAVRLGVVEQATFPKIEGNKSGATEPASARS